MEKVRRGELPWTKLDDLHRMILDELLGEFRMMPSLNVQEKDHLNRLKRKFTIAPLSNGNVSLPTAKHYKPDREAYLTAVDCWVSRPAKS